MQEYALLLVLLHYLIKHLAIILKHKRAASTFPYIEFPNTMQYSSRNYFLMMPRSTMTSRHSMNISTDISRRINAASTSHRSEIHPYSS